MENFQHSLSAHLSVQCSDNSKSQLIVLILPAMGAPTRLYKRLYDGILQADLSVAIMNLRGEGLLKKDQLVSDGNFGYVELLKDIDDVIAFITHKYPNKSIVTIGHSLGGQLGCLYSCHKNSDVLASFVIANDFFAPYSSTKSLLDKFPSSDRKISTIKADSFKEVTPNHFSWLKEPEPAINTFVSWLREKGLDRIACKSME